MSNGLLKVRIFFKLDLDFVFGKNPEKSMPSTSSIMKDSNIQIILLYMFGLDYKINANYQIIVYSILGKWSI